MPKYFGEYADFLTTSKKDASALLSADNMVGDVYDISMEMDEGNYTGWLINRFGQRVGYFDEKISRKLGILAADGLTLKAILSFVAFTSNPGKSDGGDASSGNGGCDEAGSCDGGDPRRSDAASSGKDNEEDGFYWGQVALICFNPAYTEEFDKFISNVSAKIAEDVRPRIDFDNEGVENIIESGGDWMPAQTVTLPDNGKGMAILKRRRRMLDNMIEQGRAGNKGCYVASWAILLGAVALVVFALKSCMGW